MHSDVLGILVDPVCRCPLELEECERAADDRILQGKLRGTNGRVYPIRNGIPRLVVTQESDQEQTSESFGID